MHERKAHIECVNAPKVALAKKRVCAYARVSSDRDEAFHSLSSQISYYQQVIADHPDWEFVEVFSDRGITGTKETRPGFQTMLDACREGRVDIVLAKSITRFARNTVILLETVRELKSLGIDIHFEEEHIETLSAGGELMISLLAARAQEESRSASENQKWRIKKSYQKGVPVTGNCLGYRMVNHQFLINEEEEQIVLRIFSMYLSGMGKVAIAKKLNSEGIQTHLGKAKWTARSVHSILSNEKYCGDLLLQKHYVTDYLSKKSVTNHGELPLYQVTDDHDPIIDRNTFEMTQQEIVRRAESANKTAVKKYPFSSLITCCKCGKHFRRRFNGAGTSYKKATWHCQTSNTWGKSACPSTQHIPEDILIEETCKVLGLNKTDELNEALLREHITDIDVPENNVLVYHFRDGTSKTVEWQYRSRRESWTPEMKEKARQKTKARYELKRKEKKNGIKTPD